MSRAHKDPLYRNDWIVVLICLLAAIGAMVVMWEVLWEPMLDLHTPTTDTTLTPGAP